MNITTIISTILHPIRAWDQHVANKNARAAFIKEMLQNEVKVETEDGYLYGITESPIAPSALHEIREYEKTEEPPLGPKPPRNPFESMVQFETKAFYILDPYKMTLEGNTRQIITGESVTKIREIGMKILKEKELKKLQEQWNASGLFDSVYITYIPELKKDITNG